MNSFCIKIKVLSIFKTLPAQGQLDMGVGKLWKIRENLFVLKIGIQNTFTVSPVGRS